MERVREGESELEEIMKIETEGNLVEKEEKQDEKEEKQDEKE